MRWLAGLLFVFGIPWALIAWISVVGAPGAIVEEIGHMRMFGRTWGTEFILELTGLVFFSLQSVWGYTIWARWFRLAAGYSRSSRRFWALAAIHHLIWVLSCRGTPWTILPIYGIPLS